MPRTSPSQSQSPLLDDELVFASSQFVVKSNTDSSVPTTSERLPEATRPRPVLAQPLIRNTEDQVTRKPSSEDVFMMPRSTSTSPFRARVKNIAPTAKPAALIQEKVLRPRTPVHPVPTTRKLPYVPVISNDAQPSSIHKELSAFSLPRSEERAKPLALRQPAPKLLTDDPTLPVADVVSQRQQLFFDDVLSRRFRSMVDSYAHGVRTREQLSELIVRSIKVGGLGLSEQQALAVMTTVDTLLSKRGMQVAPKLWPKQSVDANPFEAPRTILSHVSNPHIERISEVQKISETQKLSNTTSWTEDQAPTITESTHLPETSTIPVLQNIPTPQPSIPVPIYGASAEPRSRKRVTVSDPSRPTVTDVRRPVVPMGLIDELQAMDLKDFRRLGESAEEAAAAVREKMETLSQDSFTEKLKGISAWQQSPIHRLYLAMGRESVMAGTSIRDLVEQRHAANQPFLTEEEFHVIADLNHSLRF